MASVITGTSFALVRAVNQGSSAQAQPASQPTVSADATPLPEATPDGNATPLPGATPDMSKAFWFVPYENADRKKPPFVGVLGGIEIMPFDDSVPLDERGGCPPGTVSLTEPVGDELSQQPLGIRLGGMAATVTAALPQTGMACDGRLLSVHQSFDVSPGEGGGKGAGGLNVDRQTFGHRFWMAQAFDRWSEGSVNGRPAALLKPVIGTYGTSMVIVNDGEGFTFIRGEGVTLEYLLRVAAEIER
ncbi:MAG: hypothetical protein HYX53_18175 [Chloroflexi bacterium]|nr:hypothetical protein [Chloroflexota bacterium]